MSGGSQSERSRPKLMDASGRILETRDQTDSQISHNTDYCTEHNRNLYMRQTQILGLGAANRGARVGGERGGLQALSQRTTKIHDNLARVSRVLTHRLSGAFVCA